MCWVSSVSVSACPEVMCSQSCRFFTEQKREQTIDHGECVWECRGGQGEGSFVGGLENENKLRGRNSDSETTRD